MERLEDVLIAAVTRELLAEWRRYAQLLFRGVLPSIPIEIVEQSPLGRYSAHPRSIRLSLALVIDRPWGQVIEVLKHEMAHQYVVEVLRIVDETAHGPTFRRVCEDRAIDARAAGMVEGEAVVTSKVVERIRKLLALAESPNEHEARAAMNTARRLMAEHGVDLAQRARVERYTARQIGRVTGRRGKHEQLLASLLTRHFGVQAIWCGAFDVQRGARGRALEISGSFEHVEVAEYVHAFVQHTAERLWVAHRRARGLAGDGDRRIFLEGVVLGFSERLDREARQEVREEGLVLVKDPHLEAWYRRRYPVRRAGGSMRLGSGEAHLAGREAGRNIELRTAVRGEPGAEPLRIAGPRGEDKGRG
jgi:hypothetical protein